MKERLRAGRGPGKIPGALGLRGELALFGKRRAEKTLNSMILRQNSLRSPAGSFFCFGQGLRREFFAWRREFRTSGENAEPLGL